MEQLDYVFTASEQKILGEISNNQKKTETLDQLKVRIIAYEFILQFQDRASSKLGENYKPLKNSFDSHWVIFYKNVLAYAEFPSETKAFFEKDSMFYGNE